MAETAENLASDFTERGSSYTKEALGRTQAAAVQATKVVQQTYSAASKGAADFQVQVLDIAQANMNAAFDFARELTRVKSPAEFFTLSATHMRKQLETFAEQSQHLTTLTQK